MVSREQISKTLTEVIIKSHQHLTLSSEVISTLDTFRKKTRGRKTELGWLITGDGVKKYEVKGGKEEVDFGGYIDDAYQRYGEVHVEHNHPNPSFSPFPTCLSSADITTSFLYSNGFDGKCEVKSVTCEDSYNNSRMTLVRGDKFMNYKDEHKNLEQNKRLNELAKELEDLTVSKYKEFIEKENSYFDKVWGSGEYKLRTDEDFEFYHNLRKESKLRAMKEIGYYKELSRLKKEFRKIDCHLEWSDMGDSVALKKGNSDVKSEYVNLVNVR